jgi:hypothetical protein
LVLLANINKLVRKNGYYDSPQNIERHQKILNELDFRPQRSPADRLVIVTEPSLGVIHAPPERHETRTRSYGKSAKHTLQSHTPSTTDLAHDSEISISVPVRG